jgi:acyl-CoA thioesterase-1
VEAATSPGASVAPVAKEAGVPEAPVSRPRIVALGDSLTAGLGIAKSEAYPAVLERRLRAAGYDAEVVNAGLSGDTSAGALRRLDWSLDGDVRILIVALGGNDGLRGLSVEDMKANLSAMIERAQARGIAVVLAGMEAPPNFGASYTVEFRKAFREVADRHEVVFVPFLLQGVAGVAHLNQPDGIHPNPEGARRVADHLWPALQPLLDRLAPAK